MGLVDVSNLDGSERISIELESSFEYFEMTPSEIEGELLSMRETFGLEISNFTSTAKVTDDFSIKIFSFDVTYLANNSTEHRTGGCMKVGDRYYSLTITELTPDTEWKSVFFDTLGVA